MSEILKPMASTKGSRPPNKTSKHWINSNHVEEEFVHPGSHPHS
jgi:hypothetical protein